MRISLMLLSLMLLLGGVAGPAGAQGNRAGLTSTGKRCQMNAIERSRCIIEAILADIGKNYSQVGGGGISAIKQNSTTSYTVSISQEGHVDLLTYEVATDAKGGIRVSKSGETTQSR